MLSSLASIERVRPLLGTFVSIRVDGLEAVTAHMALDRAFGVVAAVHRLMSFQAPDSDISRLNREAAKGWVSVHPWTFDVLRRAQEFSAASDGTFDISIAARPVASDHLPRPELSPSPHDETNWQDIELSA